MKTPDGWGGRGNSVSCHRRNLTTGSSRSLAPRPECAMPPTAPTSTGWDSTLSFQGLPAQLGSAALLSGYQAPLTWSPSPHTSSIHPWNQWEGRNVFHYAFYYSRNQLLNFYWNLICCLQTLLFHSWSTNFYILLSKTIKSLSLLFTLFMILMGIRTSYQMDMPLLSQTSSQLVDNEIRYFCY